MAIDTLLVARLSDENRIFLDVKNDGPGIDAEAALKLFEPFFTTDAGGTGLGLFIGRELCNANGAVLEYKHQDDGSACFRIIFGVKNEF